MSRTGDIRRAICLLSGLGPLAWCGLNPQFDNRGSLEWRGFAYPQAAGNDSGSFVGDMRLRFDGGARLNENWSIDYGFAAAFDTHRQVRRDAGLFWFDRSVRRPALDLRLLSIRYTSGDWTVEAGKQIVRWGQTDLWSPTDRFAPRDILAPFDPEFLAVTALRAAWRRGDRRVEAVYTPRFTPGRLPLPLQRWLQPPRDVQGLAFRDIGNAYPGAGQFGVRFQQTVRATDMSVSYFEGFNYTPSVTLYYNPYTDMLKLLRTYPRARMLGGDVSRVTRWLTLRGEAAWFRSGPTSLTDDYVQYVAEAERLQGKWLLVAGYIGETITEPRAKNRIALDRSLTDVFQGRFQYAWNDRHEIRLEALARRTHDIYGGRASYTLKFAERWAWTAGGLWLNGDPATTLGQYRTNSHLWVGLRCSL